MLVWYESGIIVHPPVKAKQITVSDEDTAEVQNELKELERRKQLLESSEGAGETDSLDELREISERILDIKEGVTR